MQLVREINTFAMEEMQKGFDYPITGKARGKVLKMILSFLQPEERVSFLSETGRFVQFSNSTTSRAPVLTGYLGTSWCPANQDTTFFENLYYDSIENDEADLEYLLDLHLWDGFGPDGARNFRQNFNPNINLDKWAEPVGSYWNDPIDDW